MSKARMPQINQAAVSGRLTQDPEAKQTEAGQFFATFTVAVDRSYRDKQGNWENDTAFVPVLVWDKLAEIMAERLHKGIAVFITGRLKSKPCEASSHSRTELEVVARNIQILDQEEDEESHVESASPAHP